MNGWMDGWTAPSVKWTGCKVQGKKDGIERELLHEENKSKWRITA